MLFLSPAVPLNSVTHIVCPWHSGAPHWILLPYILVLPEWPNSHFLDPRPSPCVVPADHHCWGPVTPKTVLVGGI